MAADATLWITGFGWTLVPCPPFRLTQFAGNPRAVLAQHLGLAGVRQAVVTVHEAGPSHELGADTERLDEVVRLSRDAAGWSPGFSQSFPPQGGTDGPEKFWSVVTPMVAFRWPELFTLASLAGDRTPHFDLLGPDGCRIWLQGPIHKERIPPPEHLAAPGQHVDKIELIAGGVLAALDYDHDGAPWWMFHAIADSESDYTCLVSGQAPAIWSKVLADAITEITRTLTPCDNGSP